MIFKLVAGREKDLALAGALVRAGLIDLDILTCRPVAAAPMTG